MADPFDFNFSKLLKLWRKSLSLTQEEFAEKTSVNLSTYTKWESGVRNPSPEKIRWVVDKLNLTLEEFLAGPSISNIWLNSGMSLEDESEQKTPELDNKAKPQDTKNVYQNNERNQRADMFPRPVPMEPFRQPLKTNIIFYCPIYIFSRLQEGFDKTPHIGLSDYQFTRENVDDIVEVIMDVQTENFMAGDIIVVNTEKTIKYEENVLIWHQRPLIVTWSKKYKSLLEKKQIQVFGVIEGYR